MGLIIELLLKAQKEMEKRYGALPPDLVDTFKQLRDWIIDREQSK